MATWNAILDEVMRGRGTRLVAYATLLVGPAAAEDLVQDALIRSFTRERSFAHVNAAEAYVRRTMATMSIDAFRRRRSGDAGAKRFADEERLGEARATRDAERRLDVLAALASLSPRERACVLLRFYDDLTIREVSEQLGLAVGTVKRYLHDAAERLEPLLGPGSWEPERDARSDRVDVRITVVATKSHHAKRGTK